MASLQITGTADWQIKDIEDLNWAFEELKDANKGNSVLNLAIKEFQAKDEFNVCLLYTSCHFA